MTPNVRVGCAPLVHSPEDHSSAEGIEDEGDNGELDNEEVDDWHGLIQYMNELSLN